MGFSSRLATGVNHHLKIRRPLTRSTGSTAWIAVALVESDHHDTAPPAENPSMPSGEDHLEFGRPTAHQSHGAVGVSRHCPELRRMLLAGSGISGEYRHP